MTKQERKELTKYQKLNILFRSLVIKEMVLEDLEFWKPFKIVYPSWLRFPETLDFNVNMKCNRQKAIKEMKNLIICVKQLINEFIEVKTSNYVHSDPRVTDYIYQEKKRLEKHLIALRKLRKERFEFLRKEQNQENGK